MKACRSANISQLGTWSLQPQTRETSTPCSESASPDSCSTFTHFCPRLRNCFTRFSLHLLTSFLLPSFFFTSTSSASLSVPPHPRRSTPIFLHLYSLLSPLPRPIHPTPKLHLHRFSPLLHTHSTQHPSFFTSTNLFLTDTSARSNAHPSSSPAPTNFLTYTSAASFSQPTAALQPRHFS